MKKVEMVWEWNWPRIIWSWSDFQLISLTVDFRRTGDHSPGFHVFFALLGIILLEFGYYNIYHEEPEEPEESHEFMLRRTAPTREDDWLQEGVRVQVLRTAGFHQGAVGVVQFVVPSRITCWIMRDGASAPVWYSRDELEPEK